MRFAGRGADLARAPCPYLLFNIVLVLALSPCQEFLKEPGKKKEKKDKKWRQVVTTVTGRKVACTLPCWGSSYCRIQASGTYSAAKHLDLAG